MNIDLNPGTRATTATSGPGSTLTRTNTAVYGTNSAALERVNAGHTTYNALEFQLDHHLGAAYQYRVSYTYSRSLGNYPGLYSPSNAQRDPNISKLITIAPVTKATR